ncbi:MAG: hypothetical protein V3G42_07725 [Oscillospiraceae bacterium]
MSTKEKIYDIVDVLNPENIEIVYQILQRFADAQNAEENQLFYSEENIKHIEEGIRQVEEGKIVVKSMEELEEMANG